MRLAAAALALFLVLLVCAVALVGGRDPSPDEIMRRCAASQPAWNGYQEDIKEIGAGPVARWRGEPVSLSVAGSEVRVVMALQPPWDEWEAAIPLLLLDPEGRVVRGSAEGREGANRIYVFFRETAPGEPLPPWLEIQYPHTKRRIFVGPEGTWRDGSGE